MAIHVQTPLVRSDTLSRLSGRSIWLKMECSQPPGSFKIRGIGLACEEYRRRGKTRFISSSGGNAGMAVAYAGRHLDVPVTVVVPRSTSERAKHLIEQLDATVIVNGTSWAESNEIAMSMVTDDDSFIHPFDDPLLWEGHSTIIDEVDSASLKPDAVLLSVGGGGLLVGVHQGLIRNGWDGVPIIAVETEGAASLAEAVKCRRRVSLESIDTIATSLGAKQICERAFELALTPGVRSAVVSDRAAVLACRRFLDDHRTLVEPACGASLALVYTGAAALSEFCDILIIVCGGATATLDQIETWTKGLADDGSKLVAA